MDEATFNRWREIAKKSANKSVAEKAQNGEALVDIALAVK